MRLPDVHHQLVEETDRSVEGSAFLTSAAKAIDHEDRLRAAEDAVASICKGRVLRNVDLRRLSWWRIGGTGRLLVEPSGAAETQACLAALATTGIPVLVIGDGSNLLFDDAGFDGVIVRIGRSMSGMTIKGTDVSAEAGIWVPHFVGRLGRAGLTGLEHAIGIPGTLGGLVIMNGGSQRKSVGTQIRLVTGVDMSGQPFELAGAACSFRYRGSMLQDRGLIVMRTDFTLQRGEPERIRREMLAILGDRRRKFPKKQPQCGSVFLSDPAMYDKVGPPGAAIERLGMKGLRIGDAQISPMHANFFVNLGNAGSADMLALIRTARQRVHDATGFWMNCEVRHVAPDGQVRPAHTA